MLASARTPEIPIPRYEVPSGSYVINALYLVSFGAIPPRPPSPADGDPGGVVDIRGRFTLPSAFFDRAEFTLPDRSADSGNYSLKTVVLARKGNRELCERLPSIPRGIVMKLLLYNRRI